MVDLFTPSSASEVEQLKRRTKRKVRENGKGYLTSQRCPKASGEGTESESATNSRESGCLRMLHVCPRP